MRHIPLDVLCHVLQYLNRDSHPSLSQVSHFWYLATYDYRVWPGKPTQLEFNFMRAAQPLAMAAATKVTHVMEAAIVGLFGVVTYTPIVITYVLHRRQFPLPILAPLIVQFTWGGYTEMQVWNKLGLWAFIWSIGLLIFGSLILPVALLHDSLSVVEHTEVLLLTALVYMPAAIALNLHQPGWLQPGHVFTHPMVGMTLAYPLSFFWMGVYQRKPAFMGLAVLAAALAIALLSASVRIARAERTEQIAEVLRTLPATLARRIVEAARRYRCPHFGYAVAPPVVYTVSC